MFRMRLSAADRLGMGGEHVPAVLRDRFRWPWTRKSVDKLGVGRGEFLDPFGEPEAAVLFSDLSVPGFYGRSLDEMLQGR
jgi:hypothetical protein